MRLRNAWVVLLPLAAFACGGSQETSNKSAEPSAPAATPGALKVDTAVAGTVKGVVNFEGTAPKNEAIKMNADPVCVKQNKDRSFRKPTWSAATARRSPTCSFT
jgi:hypothetical protein